MTTPDATTPIAPNAPNAAELERLRQQFNHSPYPRSPLERSPKDDANDTELLKHSLVTPYYLKHRQVVSTEGKLILDAGCGSGYKALLLAMSNPGAKVIGVDLSEKSVELARQRLAFHGIDNVEFHAMLIEDLPKLGMQFDLINCDEVLYLLPDPLGGLQAMRSVLKPDGILRSNLHNQYQRGMFLQVQKLFGMMGLLDEDQDMAFDAAIETFRSLKDQTKTKATFWNSGYEDPSIQHELVFSNLLLVGDKGFTIPDLFAMLRASDLEFISMVNWRQWDVSELFKEPDNLPPIWSMGLASASVEEQLHIFELLHPVHRLLDFWCTPSEQADGLPVDDWQPQDWQQAIVHLHPLLRQDKVKAALLEAIEQSRAFEISATLPLPAMAPVMLDSHHAASLLPLWDQPQPIAALIDRYQKIKPVDPITLEPIALDTATAQIQQLLSRLDVFTYILLERSV